MRESHEATTNDPDVTESLEGNQRVNLVQRLLHKINEECRKVLKMFYFESSSMKEIAGAFSLFSVGAAKNNKLNYMKKSRAMVAENPNYIDLLT